LFQPFFQAQKGAGGTGLGLYALSNRIKALQGQYGAGGREDGAQGSEFWFSIPYRPDTELNDDSVKAYEEEIKRSSLCFNRFNETTSTGRSKLGSCDVEELANHIDGDLRQNELESTQSISLITETSQLHLPRVLLVDDSTMIQKASTRALLKEGFRVTSAMNGVECLQRLKEAKESGDLYCVVLLDLQMPVLDGFETVKRIREEERLSDLEAGVVACSSTTGDGDGAAVSFPTSWSMCNSGRRQYVIGLSANSDTESIDCVAAAGMDNFIAKPLKVSTLRKVCGPQKAL
jgi:CheY-like chemotaxis protein